MSDADPVFADWMIHLIPFLFIAALLIAGFFASIYWISSAAYKIPAGLHDQIDQAYIVACFTATDPLTSRRLDAIDVSRFTSQQATQCLSPRAYRLELKGMEKLKDMIIMTALWDQTKASDKSVPVAVHVLEKDRISNPLLITDAQLIIEVQS